MIESKHETLFPRQTLVTAFKNMIKDRALTEITVDKLTAACGLNEQIFYRYFDDIHDLIRELLELESRNVTNQYQLLTGLEDMIYYTVDYAEKNPHILCCTQDSRGREAMKEFFIANLHTAVEHTVSSLSKRAETSEEYKKFLTDFYTEALAGSLVTFLSRPGDRRSCSLSKHAHYLALTLQEVLASPLS